MAGTTTYPSSVDNKVQLTDGVDIIQADDVNDAYVPQDAIETFIGASGASQAHNTDILNFLRDLLPNVTLSRVDANTLRVSVGTVVCVNAGGTVRKIRRNTSVVDATFASNLDTGSEAASTTYYVYAVADATATTFTVLFSTSSSAPTGTTHYKRLGSFFNDASSNIDTQLVRSDQNFLDIGCISQTYLKTSIGEVSSSASAAAMTLPGGEYGFYPQQKQSDGATSNGHIRFKSRFGLASTGFASYTTAVAFFAEGGQTLYMQQRYVTASSNDHWIFILYDKVTDKVLSAYSAPDHPMYGNGGDIDKTPHPFKDYLEKPLPLHLEIITIDDDDIAVLKQRATELGKSLLTVINEDFKLGGNGTFKPRDSGRVTSGEHEKITTLPAGISVKHMTERTDAEKQAFKADHDQKITQFEVAKTQKQSDRDLAKQKLKSGQPLTEEQVVALFGD